MKRYDKITGVLAVAALSLFSACSEDTMDRINKDHDTPPVLPQDLSWQM